MTDLLWHVHQFTIPTALALLPGQMNSREARAQMLAVGLQESGFRARVQNRMGPLKTYDDMDPKAGPARGIFQFERMGGVKEILTSDDTKDYALPICRMFLFDPNPQVVHAALAFNDVLACVFARLLLWRDPRPMPSPIQTDAGLKIYLANWRPGKPRPEHWPENFAQAWRIVKGEAE